MIRTVYALCAVLGVSLFLAGEMDWTGETYALIMMAVDTIAAIVILIRPAGKAQAMVGLTLLLQVTVYFARILSGDHANFNAYWWQLSALAFLQLAIVGGWWLYELADRKRPVPGRGAMAHPSHSKSMDP